MKLSAKIQKYMNESVKSLSTSTSNITASIKEINFNPLDLFSSNDDKK